MKRRLWTVYATLFMLSYAWCTHFFYGFILDRTGESPEHAGFWSVLYPISIFLLSLFYGKAFKSSKKEIRLTFFSTLIGGFLFCILLWQSSVFTYISKRLFWFSLIILFIACVIHDLLPIKDLQFVKIKYQCSRE